MNGKFFEDSGSRCNRVRTAEKRQICLLCCCKESPCCCLVTIDVSVKSLWLVCRLDAVCVGDCLDIRCIIETILENLLVRLHKLRLLLSELALEILEDILHRTIIDVACHTESEHILALLDCLPVQATVLKTLMSEGCDWSHNDSSVLYMHLRNRITLKACSCQTGFIECIRIDEYHRCPLEPFRISFESCRIHCHEKITEVSGCGDVLASNMYLEAGHA